MSRLISQLVLVHQHLTTSARLFDRPRLLRHPCAAHQFQQHQKLLPPSHTMSNRPPLGDCSLPLASPTVRSRTAKPKPRHGQKSCILSYPPPLTKAYTDDETVVREAVK
ncbi:uncharacterized protein M421DRAFT_284098 [Didymella exigua CBS 183.55]|uniref:Uncharacterized protein n=1 Tax=Didymella exigua CBS 183.55 TaxID=1150837 RepID=A0A6A5RUD1_9PLEO|nr:uncharacterized protein M421DRAFT_284098 [Didymella exigua CBS 183.55]KAF1932075.1 hypothetical protein M421DRAFT_284098 [Didymella exigua CBS 183.55]